MWPSPVEEVRLAVVGAERAVLRPVLAHHRQQRAQVARVGRLADQHPHAAPALLQRLRRGERLVVGADPGRRRTRSARCPSTPGACPSTCGATIRPSTSGSPAMTPGKFIISATPSARGCRRIAAHVVRPERPAGRLEAAGRHARGRHHEHVERQALGGLEQPVARPRRRPRSRSRAGRRPPPSSPAGPPPGRTRTGVSLADSRCTCASMNPGTRKRPSASMRGRRRRRRRPRSARRRPPRRPRATRA